jgi:hypothetical protein
MIVKAFTQCDICGKKIVLEVAEEEETIGANKLIVRGLEGTQEYDVCDACVLSINLQNGRKVVITTYEIVE